MIQDPETQAQTTREPADAHATVLDEMGKHHAYQAGCCRASHQRDPYGGYDKDLALESAKAAACRAGAAALRAREDAGRADGTRFRAAVEAYDAYMAAQFREGPSSSAIHPNARAMWLQARAALAASPAPAPTTTADLLASPERLRAVARAIATYARHVTEGGLPHDSEHGIDDYAYTLREALLATLATPPDTGGPQTNG